MPFGLPSISAGSGPAALGIAGILFVLLAFIFGNIILGTLGVLALIGCFILSLAWSGNFKSRD